MLSSSRFVVAVHALSVLVCQRGKAPVCSNAIAASVHTNPVVIRRLMTELEAAGLVTSTAGRSGGFSLARAAESITLADVYTAVEDETVFRMHKIDPNADCPVAAQLGKALSPSLRAAESAMTRSLGLTSLADVSQAIHREEAAA
ncbi:MAG: Rrf2 family transcriptional regulator [Proteobacteria bacterium]|nr:Rrf2 family transcriptional regulator [Pseudomonadota bacterium]